MGNDITDVYPSLERQLALRSFNRAQLEMETASGSILNRAVGVGTRIDPDTGQTKKITETYPSYFDAMVRAFEYYHKEIGYFGLSIDRAMELPVNRWYRIRKSVELLKEHQQPDAESQTLKVLAEMVSVLRRGGEE